MHLVIPAAGRSTRYPNLRPKWMLTHPSGNMMLAEALRGLNLRDFERIHLVLLQEHVDQYRCIPGIRQQFEMLGALDKLSLVILEKPTASQPETIAQAITRERITGPFFSKDTDNYFVSEIKPENCVCVSDLNHAELINAANKSYVQFNEHGLVTNIIEKSVISNHFCVGGYGFASAESFLEYHARLAGRDDIYVSDVIFQMLLDNHLFFTRQVGQCLDWGTLEDWNRYKRQFAVLFVDMDGTLVGNSSHSLPPYWGETAGIRENIDTLNRLYDSGKVQIILTTSRTEAFREATLEQLKREGIKHHHILFGLFHAKRLLINDYSPSNPYKSCDAINLRCDSAELKEMLEDAMQL